MKVQFSRNVLFPHSWLTRQRYLGEVGEDGKDREAGWNVRASSKINLAFA